MGVTILDGGATSVSEVLTESLEQVGKSYERLDLEKMFITPCRNCGACNDKHPGKCAAQDETGRLIKSVVHSEFWILITPVSFGGYSATAKKAMDKLVLTALPIFINDKGRLQHPSRYPKESSKPNMVIALTNHTSELQKESFEKLIEANRKIMMSAIQLIFIDAQEPVSEMQQKLMKVLKEAI